MTEKKRAKKPKKEAAPVVEPTMEPAEEPLLKIEFTGDMPRYLRDEVEQVIREFSFLFPSWLRYLRVRYEPGEKQHLAMVTAASEYRQASMVIHPNIQSESPDIRRQTVVHEMLHIPLSPMAVFTLELLEEIYGDDEPTRNFLDKQFRKTMEGAVEDLAYAFVGLLPPRDEDE